MSWKRTGFWKVMRISEEGVFGLYWQANVRLTSWAKVSFEKYNPSLDRMSSQSFEVHPCTLLVCLLADPLLRSQKRKDKNNNSSWSWFSNIIQYTLTGHFVRYTSLLPGCYPFVFRTAFVHSTIDTTMYNHHLWTYIQYELSFLEVMPMVQRNKYETKLQITKC